MFEPLRELFLSLSEARYVLDEWRLDYNHHRRHGSLECAECRDLRSYFNGFLSLYDEKQAGSECSGSVACHDASSFFSRLTTSGF